ncbi:hypothetical protein EJB05_31619, partial [Eragrostis curvula]
MPTHLCLEPSPERHPPRASLLSSAPAAANANHSRLTSPLASTAHRWSSTTAKSGASAVPPGEPSKDLNYARRSFCVRENSEMKYECRIRSELLLQSKASQAVMNSNNGR